MLAAARAVGADARRPLHARHDGRDQRVARAQGRAHCLRDERRLRAPAPLAPAEPRFALPPVRPHPEPLVPLDRCLGVRGRMGPTPSSRRSSRTRCRNSMPKRSPSACCTRTAIPPTSAPSPPSCGAAFPDVHVVCSHEIAPEFREYERASTTAIDAYLGPGVAGYLRALAERCAEAGLPEPLVMRSSGGVAELEEAAAHPARRARLRPGCRSRRGRARGATRRLRERDLVRHGRDFDGRLPHRGRRARRARPSARSAASRCGSRRWICTRSAQAADRSSGATPAAGCASALRARAPTRARRVTDAVARARRSPTPTSCSGGCRRASPPGIELDVAAAERAFGEIDPEERVALVNAEMLRALRVVSVERGHDPRDFALVAFGGAGPLHACALAEELEMRTVLVPDAAGVLSALGLVASDERRDRVRSYLAPLREAGELPARGRGRPPLRGPVLRADRPAAARPRRGVPSRARGALRIRRPQSRHRARRRAHGRRAARARRSSCRRGERFARPARPCSSSTARRAGFPPGGWGLGMVPRWYSRDCEHRAPDHRQRPARDRRGDGRRARSAPPSRRTSRSGATARPRCSTSAAGWSCRPSTSPCTSARCPTRSPPSCATTRARTTSGSSTTRSPAARICPTSRSCRAPRSVSPRLARITPTSAAQSRAACRPSRARSKRRES